VKSMMSAAGPVSLADPKADLSTHREAVLAALARVIDSGTYILGPEVEAFEIEAAQSIGARGGVGVASGTDALVLTMVAAGISMGDEVITVSHTAGATVAAINLVGAVPVLVDIEEEGYCLGPDCLDGALGPRTKAILPVHLYGQPADLECIGDFAKRHSLALIEDCAQAMGATLHGRKVGSIGDAGCLSFYPTKILGALGDGGLVVSSDEELLNRLRRLRTYGWTKPQFAEVPLGRCSRLDEIQAAVLRVKLDRLEEDLAKRRALAEAYGKAFADLPIVCPCPRHDASHVYHLYVIRCDRRDDLREFLDRWGIGTGIHYPYPVHLQPGLTETARIPAPLTVTEKIGKEILSLPLYPGLSAADHGRVIDAVRRFFGKGSS